MAEAPLPSDLKPFVIPAVQVDAPTKLQAKVRTPPPPLLNSDDEEEKPSAPSTPDVDELVEKMSTLTFIQNSREVTNISLRAPLKPWVFTSEKDERKLLYLLANLEQVSKTVPKEVALRDIDRIGKGFNVAMNSAAYRQQSKQMLSTVSSTLPLTGGAFPMSPIVALLIGNQETPLPAYDGTYNQLERLYTLISVAEQTIIRLPDMLPPNRLKPEMSDEERSSRIREYLEDIHRSFKYHTMELNKWFDGQMSSFKKNFPALDAAFWTNIQDDDWSKATPIKNIAINSSSDSNQLTWNTLKVQVLPKFQAIRTLFTLAYLNICEAKLLNTIGWIVTYPETTAKQRRYTQVWPNMGYLGTDQYMNDLSVAWRRFFITSVLDTPALLQKLYWQHQLDNSKQMSEDEKAKIASIIEAGEFERLWMFGAIVPERVMCANHLAFLMHILRENKFNPINDQQTWAGLLHNKVMDEEFSKIIASFDVDKAEEENLRSICAELQLYIHPLMYRT